jgi:hypothetical protein
LPLAGDLKGEIAAIELLEGDRDEELAGIRFARRAHWESS